MNKTPLTTEEAKAYLQNDFRYDLRKWFTFEGLYKGCDFIPHMDSHFNPCRPINMMIENDARRSHIFAAAFRVMIELTQSIWNGDGGEAAAVQFCKDKGWPICSAGLGGPLISVETMVREAGLVPDNEKNVEFYNAAIALFSTIMAKTAFTP